MQYRKDKQGNDLSALGFGCMRFPRKDGKIDLEETEREILEAVELGINYFDTAYIYGGSEEALGEIVKHNALRDRIRITTKLPQYLVTKNASLDKYFSEHLKRLRTDRVDYYLMHHLTDLAMWDNLKSVGAPEWQAEKKRSGEIGAVGFSYEWAEKTGGKRRFAFPRCDHMIYRLKAASYNLKAEQAESPQGIGIHSIFI